MTLLVGGVGQLYQGDLDLGRRAAKRLAAEDLGPDVRVEDLHYGALAFAQLLEELRPEALVLVGAVERGRPAGKVERRWVGSPDLAPEALRGAVEGAGVGYVSMDLAVEVPWALGTLPERTIAVEVEPARTEPSEELSPEGAAALEAAVALVRAEVRRVPLLQLADRLRARLEGHRGLEPSPALHTLRDLLSELEVLEGEGRWGAAFSLRDRLRLRIAAGRHGEGMGHLDWGLWWGLIEELDRLEPLEAST